MYLYIFFWLLLLIISLVFAAGDNYIQRFTGVILRVYMLGLLASPVAFFSDSLGGPVVSSTTTLYRIMLSFNALFIYIGIAAVFELADRDLIGRKRKAKKTGG